MSPSVHEWMAIKLAILGIVVLAIALVALVDRFVERHRRARLQSKLRAVRFPGLTSPSLVHARSHSQ